MKLFKDDPNLQSRKANTETCMRTCAADEFSSDECDSVGRGLRSGTFRYTPPTPYAFPGFFADRRSGGSHCIVNASARSPCSISDQLAGTAIGLPGLARGDHAPIAVVPRPLRR